MLDLGNLPGATGGDHGLQPYASSFAALQPSASHRDLSIHRPFHASQPQGFSDYSLHIGALWMDAANPS
eukprot:890796-Prymnesium_polylepis.1